ncbi:MAG: signal peptidase I [Lachnospiraceae bacterium]|nr:signal peptidase I [Lachnospiraceae bacterium]
MSEANETSQHEEKQKVNIVKEIFSWIKIIITAFIIAYILTHFIIVNAKVPTGSMENTIPTGSRIIGSRLTYEFSDPERLDIIIFKAPDSPEENYVKRLIGLPGETVRINNAVITIETTDGKTIELEEDYLKEDWFDSTGPYEFKIPEDSYLMLGDNRNYSNDARKWKNTYVKRDAILGKVEFMYYPSFKWLR